MIRPIALLAAAAASVSMAVAPAQSETLSDALVAAYTNSHLLEQNRALLRAADEQVPQALAALKPIVNYALSRTRTANIDGSFYSSAPGRVLYSTTLSISAEIVLYAFGRNKMGVELAQKSVLATREQLREVEQQVLLSAVQAYVGMISSQEFVTLQQNNVRLISEELRAAQDRFELGEITVTDVSLAEAQLAAARAELANAQGNLQIAREQYIAAVGHAPGVLAPPPAAPATARTLDEAKSIAQRLHPTVVAGQHQVEVAELNIRIAQATMLPTVSGSITYGIDENDNRGATAALQLSGPIYQGGALSSSYRSAVANRDASRASLLQTGVTVVQNVGTAWAQRNVAQAQLASSEGQISSARVAYRGIREEATLGARTTLDVLSAEQDLLDAEANRISAFANYYSATYALLGTMGLLTVDHLKLNVVQYDPQAYYNAVKNGPIVKVSPQGKKLDWVLQRMGKQ